MLPAQSGHNHLELTSFDSNVPLLAIEAANELDELIVGRGGSLDAVERLKALVQRSFPTHPENAKSFLDSGTVAVFSEAFSEIDRPKQVKTVDELKKRAKEIEAALNLLDKSTNDPTLLKKLRAFCLALAASAASFRNSVYEVHPPHPFEA